MNTLMNLHTLKHQIWSYQSAKNWKGRHIDCFIATEDVEICRDDAEISAKAALLGIDTNMYI